MVVDFLFFRFNFLVRSLPQPTLRVAHKHPHPARNLIALWTLCATIFPADLLAQAFSYEFIMHEMAAVDFADADWGDIDQDGDFDLILTGLTQGQFSSPLASAYFNFGQIGSVDARGDSVWSQNYVQLGQGLTPVWLSSARWNDIDNNGQIDVTIVGARSLQRPFNPIGRVYELSGSRFNEKPASIPGVYGGSIDYGDYDNDGDADLLITGETDDGRLTQILENQGDGTFVAAETGLVDVSIGDGRFGDYDSDGDLDVILTGDTGEGFVTALYRNDGGVFTEVPFAFPPLAFSSVDWGDYDNDGNPDVLLAGGTLSPLILDGHAYVFRNNGDGTFTDIGADLDGVFYGAAKWGDYDNDGLSDIMLSGATDLQELRLGRMYHNQGGGVFRLSINLAGILFSAAAFGDYDGDGDLDVVQVGDGVTNQYRNDQLRVNDPPEAPAGLAATGSADAVTLSWQAPFDAQTPSAGLSYSIRVGTAPGAVDVVAPLAHLDTGRRLVSGLGNVHQNTSWTLRDLSPGTYFWAVQAIDNSYAGSAFSDEASFTVSSGGGIATSVESEIPIDDFRLASSYPNPFADGATLEFSLGAPASVEVAVFNMLGERVRVLHRGLETAGNHRVMWDGTAANGNRVGAGFYIVRLSDGVRHSTLKLVKAL